MGTSRNAGCDGGEVEGEQEAKLVRLPDGASAGAAGVDEVEGEQEAKLVRLPKDGAVLVAEIRKFAEERGCAVKAIGVPDASTFVKVGELALESLGVEVHLMAEVREGCVLLTSYALQEAF